MIDEKVLLGFPLPYKFGLFISVPTVNDFFGNPNFQKFMRIFTFSQEEIEDELTNYGQKELGDQKIPTPFEFLLINCYANADYKRLAEEGFEFFTGSKMTISYKEKALILGDLEEEIQRIKTIDDLNILREEDYFEFQNLIRRACGVDQVEPPKENENPKIKQMKQKARYRDMIKAKHASKNGTTMGATLLSISFMDIGLNLLNIGEISYAALSWITQMYQNKERYELDVKSLLAGASAKKVKPKYWIHDFEK